MVEDELRERAYARIADMPAETAEGRADPQGPSQEDPAPWETEHPGPER